MYREQWGSRNEASSLLGGAERRTETTLEEVALELAPGGDREEDQSPAAPSNWLET